MASVSPHVRGLTVRKKLIKRIINPDIKRINLGVYGYISQTYVGRSLKSFFMDINHLLCATPLRGGGLLKPDRVSGTNHNRLFTFYAHTHTV